MANTRIACGSFISQLCTSWSFVSHDVVPQPADSLVRLPPSCLHSFEYTHFLSETSMPARTYVLSSGSQFALLSAQRRSVLRRSDCHVRILAQCLRLARLTLTITVQCSDLRNCIVCENSSADRSNPFQLGCAWDIPVVSPQMG